MPNNFLKDERHKFKMGVTVSHCNTDKQYSPRSNAYHVFHGFKMFVLNVLIRNKINIYIGNKESFFKCDEVIISINYTAKQSHQKNMQ